jgi:uncharacterized protein
MPPLSVMFKTVSSDCNLDCLYCYYRQSLEGERVRRRMDIRLLDGFLPQYMEYVADSHQVNLSWQGGEPTLAGLDFFRQTVELEAKYARPPTVINNAIQTNAVLVDDEWAEFFAAYRFLVGVSLDGPEEIHDAVRKDRGGNGSFRRVIAGIEALRKRKVDLNILCVVGPHNVRKARELMAFFRREGLTYLQFIPAMGFQSTEPDKPPAYLISPEAYAEFLVSLFNEWYREGIPTVSVRIFDNFLQSAVGSPNNLCVYSEKCDSGVIIEYNGDVFPCDFYIHPEWRLGNISIDSFKGIVESTSRQSFVRRKISLPSLCLTCEWRNLCKGECPRNWPPVPGGYGTSYFCQSYRTLFEHAGDRIGTLAARIAGYRNYLAWQHTHPGARLPRNGGCPCGSGRKFKNCCGAPELAASYLFRQ